MGYGVKIFHPSPLNYVTRSPGGMRVWKEGATWKIRWEDEGGVGKKEGGVGKKEGGVGKKEGGVGKKEGWVGKKEGGV